MTLELTRITGPLATKGCLTAHQNCLLYSSGICCENSPEFDDLFGFSVDDVTDEVKRGTKLWCDKCKKKGATAGCERRQCKKSFHYPCAIEKGAVVIEDAVKGKYGLYCSEDCQAVTENKKQSTASRQTSSFREPEKPKNHSNAASPNPGCFLLALALISFYIYVLCHPSLPVLLYSLLYLPLAAACVHALLLFYLSFILFVCNLLLWLFLVLCLYVVVFMSGDARKRALGAQASSW
uniref:PHD-type domain-containing protein n=1 Tax=Myripristis murdjan TaxID=586833 RepID=A0A667Y894_9TELE